MAILPAPVNKLLNGINIAIDFLIKGLGESAAIVAGTTAAPFLALPVINIMFKGFVSWLGTILDVLIKQNIDYIVIRFQDHISKDTFDKVFNKLKQDQANPGVDPNELAKDIQAAEDAADKLIHMGRV